MSEAERAGASRQDKSERLLAGRYRLGDVLGRGGMGTVWRAEDETLGRTVAVKELRFPSAIDEDEKRRLITRTLREAKAIARIRNNGAVTVFDVVDEDNRPWIVMELIEGKSLAEAIREDGLLTPKRAAEVGLAILDVLRSAHREGILHRDVKPSNVLMSDDGRVVLTDFGIAQVEGDPSITSTGMLVGAPSYISPERARGHKPGPAADLWSLGGLLYASVEGVPPYDKGSAIATLTAVMTEPVEQPKNAGPLENVIYGLLAKDPEQRLDDAGARAMLNEVLHAPEPEQSAPEPPDATKVVAMPPLPEEPGRRGAGGFGSGAKKGEEPAERLRGALRSVRKAATAAGAATAAATSAAATRAKTVGGSDSSRAEGAAKTASPRTGAGSGGAAGSGGGTSAPSASAGSSVPGAPSVPGQAGSRDGASVDSGSAGGGGAAGAAGTRGASGSGWPAAPERPARPVPKASLTDVVPLRTLVVLAVVVALVVIGIVLALTLGGGDDNGTKSNGGKATASSGATAGSGKGDGGKDGGKSDSDAAHTDKGDKSGSGSGSDDSTNTSSGTDASAGTSDDSSGDGKESGSGSGSGSTAVTTYKSGQGFSIGLPKGWKFQSQDAAGARFAGPDGQKLLVGWTATPKDDPVADWKNQERYMTRSQYAKVRIEKVEYRSWNTADWEFTYVDGGTKYRSIDRGFVVNSHQGYALMYTAKASAWDSALRKSTWATLTETFQPKS
ncbi:serine/threonine-protein kinase [Streptomyces rhizosphaerihabitans]|uniref:serine/threonine-protein kinase n=1 Tax=Streptomyces rhizosphaerihabitans TaxID=1266770 RepID=UPI0021C05353|nr:serine/threonine-protein kinase [Streptomyces rhizosphaerihabitans]MCT9007027.1 serine/threonine protein kinase [Streptomyces rhizosphaerihabitans]